jgi:hypothetical protein
MSDAVARKQGRRKRGWASVRNCTTSPAAIERAYRAAEACRLRARGLSYPAISCAMGIPIMTVYDMVRGAVASCVRPERAEAERALELQRLDALQAAVFNRAAHGDAKAINAVLAIMDHRARLLGLAKAGD